MNRIDILKDLFERSFSKAAEAVKTANEEMTRPLTFEETYERDEANL